MAGTTASPAAQRDSWAAFDVALAAAVSSGPGRADARVVDDDVEAARLDALRAADCLADALRRLPDTLLIETCSRAEQLLAAERLLAVARVAGCSGDARVDRRRARNAMADDVGRSNRSVSQDARRSAAVAANSRLGEQLAEGAIAPQSIDALVRAADEETGKIPVELVDAVEGLAPDQASRVVSEHLEATADAVEVERQYDLQRQARRAYRYESPSGDGRPALSGIAVEGPRADIDLLWAEVVARADAAYQSAGGRDVPAHQHQLLRNRCYDAVTAAVRGDSSGSLGGERVSRRPTVVITVDAEKLFDDPDRPVVASQLGSGPIPEHLLVDYLSSGAACSLVARFDGVPLWYGRSRRNASDAQFVTLAVRDRGCVLCRATIDRCEAHHLLPWTAPGRGRTDVDNMALLCRRCHQDLHHRNHTLEHQTTAQGKRHWSTRSATVTETPAPKPRRIQRE